MLCRSLRLTRILPILDTIVRSRIVCQSCFENFAVYEFVASRPSSLGHRCVIKEISSWHSDHWHLDNLERNQGNRGLNYSHLSRMWLGAWLFNCILKLGRHAWCCKSCLRVARFGWVTIFCDNWRPVAKARSVYIACNWEESVTSSYLFSSSIASRRFGYPGVASTFCDHNIFTWGSRNWSCFGPCGGTTVVFIRQILPKVVLDLA